MLSWHDSGRFTILFDHFDQVYLSSERKYLPAANPFENYDNKKFQECKTILKRVLNKVSVKLHTTSPTLICVLKLTHLISFIHSFILNDELPQ